SPSGGHGHVLFKMKSNPNVQTTGHVTSNANIFFDYNFPIETNDATTVFETLSNQDFTKDATITIAPNPAEDSVTLSAQSNINAITIFDAQGRIVQFIKADSLQKTIDVNHLKTGMYILEIQTETGKKVEKLMKK
ncbi:T9SS type A sorting domain-containing protein, partial [Flavobacterium branchiophilum]